MATHSALIFLIASSELYFYCISVCFLRASFASLNSSVVKDNSIQASVGPSDNMSFHLPNPGDNYLEDLD